MDEIIRNMSPEERAQLQQALQASEGGPAPQPARITVSLPDGTPFTGTEQEVNAALQQRYQAAQQPPPAPGQEQAQRWNQDEWSRTLVKDGREGMQMYFDRELGFHPKAGFELVGQALKVIGERLNRLDRDKFTERHQGIKDEHFDTLNKIVQDNGWALTQESLDNAYYIARGRGIIEEPAPTATPQLEQRGGMNAHLPVHINSAGSGSSLPVEDAAQLKQLGFSEDMSTAELGQFLRSNAPGRTQ